MRLFSLLVLGAVLLAGCSTFDRSGNDRYSDRYERGPRSYPASARVDSRGGEPRYRMCHDGRDTRTVRERDVRSHLRHGDRFGSCRDDRNRADRRNDRYQNGPRSYPRWAREVARNGQVRYQMCHNGRKDKTYPESAVRAHLDHGDRFGSCRGRGRDRDRNRGRGRGRN